MSVKLGPRGAAIIKARETLRLTSYLPTPNDVWTIGWGHTRGVKPGMHITKEQAEVCFLEDTAEATSAVNKLADRMASKGFYLTQGMVDALISLAFNIQSAVLPSNTIGRALLQGKYYEAWVGFTLYRKQRNDRTGELEDLLGLARRRTEEMMLFLEDGLP